MRPEAVPPGPLLVDTDVVTTLALREDRYVEFAELVEGHDLFVCYVTVAEIRTFLNMAVLSPERAADLEAALGDYRSLPVDLDEVVAEWARLRSATVTLGDAQRPGAPPERHLDRGLRRHRRPAPAGRHRRPVSFPAPRRQRRPARHPPRRVTTRPGRFDPPAPSCRRPPRVGPDKDLRPGCCGPVVSPWTE